MGTWRPVGQCRVAPSLAETLSFRKLIQNSFLPLPSFQSTRNVNDVEVPIAKEKANYRDLLGGPIIKASIKKL
ncbi:hypothetical protein VNO77_03642 [Canavalia gladiata]|uniref:Uncharacterized protein n=1 Tax=Canavalia gladiata TaxID=3824 RepID=A0AAN9MVP4_CANGL